MTQQLSRMSGGKALLSLCFGCAQLASNQFHGTLVLQQAFELTWCDGLGSKLQTSPPPPHHHSKPQRFKLETNYNYLDTALAHKLLQVLASTKSHRGEFIRCHEGGTIQPKYDRNFVISANVSDEG
jgi:hypothetical protein